MLLLKVLFVVFQYFFLINLVFNYVFDEKGHCTKYPKSHKTLFCVLWALLVGSMSVFIITH